MTLDKYIESKFLGKFANLYLANDSHNTNRKIVHELVYLEDNDNFKKVKLKISKVFVLGQYNYAELVFYFEGYPETAECSLTVYGDDLIDFIEF